MPVLTVAPDFAAVCRARGFSYADVARALGLGRNTVHRWATRRRDPNPDNLRKLVTLFQLSGPEDLGYVIITVERVERCAE